MDEKVFAQLMQKDLGLADITVCFFPHLVSGDTIHNVKAHCDLDTRQIQVACRKKDKPVQVASRITHEFTHFLMPNLRRHTVKFYDLWFSLNQKYGLQDNGGKVSWKWSWKSLRPSQNKR